MKKRLLSAALVLAMVLTMLPLTAMPAFAETPVASSQDSNDSGKVNATLAANDVYYPASGDNKTLQVSKGSWYYTKTANNTTTYYVLSGGVVVTSVNTSSATGTSGSSGKWYADINDAVETGNMTGTGVNGVAAVAKGNATGIRLIGSSGSFNLDLSKVNQTTLAIDLDGNNLTITNGNLHGADGANSNKTNLTTLTLQNTAKNTNGTVKEVTASGAISATNQQFTLNVFNVNTATGAGSGLSLTVTNEPYTNASNASVTTNRSNVNVTVDNARMGAITTKLQGLTLTARNKAEVGAVKINENIGNDNRSLGITQSTVTVNTGSKTGEIVFNGKGTITASDLSELGDVTLYGGQKDTTNKTLPSWGGGITVNVSGQTKTGNINEAANNEASHTITVTGGSSSRSVGQITMNKSASTTHTITLNGAHTGAVGITAGTLSISNGASIGSLWLGTSGSTGGVLTVNISGSTTTVGAVNLQSSKIDPTINISDATMGSLASLKTYNYSKKTITSGTFSESLANSGWLKNAVFELQKGGKYTYTTQFQDAVNAYSIAPDTVVVAVGADPNNATDVEFYVDPKPDPDDASLQQGGTPPKPVVTIKTDVNAPIRLPDKVNGVATKTWYVGVNDSPRDANTLYILNEADKSNGVVHIKTTSTAADNSNIVGVRVHKDDENQGLSASLSGNTIRVSGALMNGTGNSRTIYLAVETAAGKTYKVHVVYSIADKELQFVKCEDGGSIVGMDNNHALGVNGSTASWPLDGSGLTVPVSSVGSDGLKSNFATAEATVSGVTGQLQSTMKEELEKTTADFSNSKAVEEAVNKVIAGVSESQANTWLTNARREAYKKDNPTVTNPNTEQINSMSAWKNIKIVPYLQIAASNWDQSGSGNSITLNLTPYYRVQVTTDGADEPFTAQAGRPLDMNSTTSDFGWAEVTLSLPDNFRFGAGKQYAHHNSTYVYEISGNKFTTYHGFSPFVLNNVGPMASVNDWEGKDIEANPTDTVRYYDNVQKAIDDVVEGGEVELLEKYTGSTNFTVTGKARTFTFKVGPNGDKEFTFSGDVTRENTNSGNYNVQLNSDNVSSSSGRATITVSSASNGSASVSSTYASAGTTITITTRANSGYTPLMPTVSANNGAAVSVSASSNGTYTFVVPSGATSITVTPSFVLTSSSLPFTDVSTTAWYYDAVRYCYTTYSNGTRLMGGFSDTTFGVNRPMTRAELVTVLWRISGSQVETVRSNFVDVSSAHYAYNAIIWAYNHGYVTGYGANDFQPERNISRQELAVILWRYAGTPDVSINLAATYADGQGVAAWAQSAMQWAAGRSILSGRNSVALSKLDAYETAYRSELAVTIMKYHRAYVA